MELAWVHSCYGIGEVLGDRTWAVVMIIALVSRMVLGSVNHKKKTADSKP